MPELDLATGYSPATLSALEATSGAEASGAPTSTIQEILAQANQVLVVGALGTGKTALLRALAWELASSLSPAPAEEETPSRATQAQGGHLPIFVDLAAFAHNGQPPFELLFASLGQYGLPATRSFLRDHLQQGQCMLICDNLHRLSDPVQRAQFAEMVDRFGRNVWIIAKRPTTWTLDLSGFKTAILRGTECCSLAACLDQLAGDRSADLAPLYAACERNTALRDLASLPLMAAAMVRRVLASAGQAVRVPDLYEACITTCLGEWETGSREGAKLPLADQMAILQAIALEMQQACTWSISRDSLRRLVAEHPSSAGQSAVGQWIDDLAAEGGILGPVAEGNSDLAFFSPSMQSNLAAREIMRLGAVRDVLPVVGFSEWHSTVVSLASLFTDPTPFLRQIAEHDAKEPDKWYLLAHCLAEVEGDTAAIRSNVEERLWALVESPDCPDCSAALTALAGMEHVRVRDYLESALQGRNALRKRRAILACGWVREAWSTPYLGMATLDPELDLAPQAARVLGLIPSSQSARFLARAIKEGPVPVRPVAAQALVSLGRADAKLDPYVVQTLVGYLESDDTAVAQLAEQSLLELGQASMPELAKILNDERLPQARRVRVAKIVGSLGSDKSLPLLIEATLRARLEDLHGYVQAIAAVGPAAVPHLIDALEGKDVTRAAGLTWSLLAIGAPAVQPVIEALGAPHPEVRNAAARILEQMPQDAIQPLIHAVLADSRLEIRKPALEILGRIGTDEVVSALIKALDDRIRSCGATQRAISGGSANPWPWIPCCGHWRRTRILAQSGSSLPAWAGFASHASSVCSSTRSGSPYCVTLPREA